MAAFLTPPFTTDTAAPATEGEVLSLASLTWLALMGVLRAEQS